MIPIAFPDIAAAVSLGEVFGPLAVLAALFAVAGAALVATVVAIDARAAARRRRRPRDQAKATPPPLRPAA